MWSSAWGSSSSYGGGGTYGDIRSRISGVFDHTIARIKELPVTFLMQYRSVPTSEAAARLHDRVASGSRFSGGLTSTSSSGSFTPAGKRARALTGRHCGAVTLLVVGCVLLAIGLQWIARQQDAGFFLLLLGVLFFVPGIYSTYESFAVFGTQSSSRDEDDSAEDWTASL